MNKIHGFLPVWNSMPASIFRIEKDEDPDKTLSKMAFCGVGMDQYGWVQLGIAEITVTMFSSKETIGKQVIQLKKAKEVLMAKHQFELNTIEASIQNLLCIENNPKGE